MEAVPVTVVERCLPDGMVTPISITWDMTEYKIDRVVERRQDVIRKTGEVAVRYLVEIRGQRRYMFRSTLNKWLLVPRERPTMRRGGRHCCKDILDERR